MRQAYEAVVTKRMKIREAARHYGVPHSTLLNKLSIKSPLQRRMGPPTKLSKDDEKALVQFIQASAQKGFPVSRKTLLILGNEISGAKLGIRWVELFLKRHKEISVTSAGSNQRGKSTWHSEFRQYLEESRNEEILQNTKIIANSDEIDNEKCREREKQAEDRNTVALKFSYSHLLAMESILQPGRAEEFRTTYDQKSEWKGDNSASELYEVWYKIRSSIEPDDPGMS